MGKYIKGKKLPKGISQRKDDGKFIAGFVDKGWQTASATV